MMYIFIFLTILLLYLINNTQEKFNIDSYSETDNQEDSFNTVQSEHNPSENIPSENIPSENIPSENIPSENIPSENIESEFSQSDKYNKVTTCLSDSYQDLHGLSETLKTGTELVNQNINYLDNIQSIKGNDVLNNINGLEYKKALIDASKIQGYEDIYLYKLNESMN